LGSIYYCGISGCSGGGFGVTTASRDRAWMFCALAGAIVAGVLVLAPWHKPFIRRLVIAALSGLVIASLLPAWWSIH
jgi:hypothetical protein